MEFRDREGKTREIEIFFDKVPSNGGRPIKVLTEDALKVIERLSSRMLSEETIAGIFGCSRDLFHTEANDALFRQAKLKGRSRGEQSLMEKQYEVAMKGNVNMLKWLGIQHLHQSHKVEVDANVSQDEKFDLMEKYINGTKGDK